MSYWEHRRGHNYYRIVREWIDALGPLDSLIDVGCHDTPIATYGTARRRYALDLRRLPQLPGVIGIKADWTLWRPPHRFELLTCLQVIEHLPADHIRPFVDKLFACSRRQILSVPYRWPADACKSHVHDPIDQAKFLRLVGNRPPRKIRIIRDGNRDRLVALFGPRATGADRVSPPALS